MADQIVVPALNPATVEEIEGVRMLTETIVRQRDEHGIDRRAPLQEAARWPLWRAMQIREFPSHKGQRNITGLYYCATGDSLVGFESLLEEAALKRLDFDETIVAVAAQPCELRFLDGSRHVPDFAVRLQDGRGGLIDVSTEHDAAGPDKARAFANTRAVCEVAGWEYRVETEPDPVLQANINWLSCYRRQGPEFDHWAPLIRSSCAEPCRFDEIASLGDSPFLIPTIGRLLWLGELGIDLTLPLRESTRVWLRVTEHGVVR